MAFLGFLSSSSLFGLFFDDFVEPLECFFDRLLFLRLSDESDELLDEEDEEDDDEDESELDDEEEDEEDEEVLELDEDDDDADRFLLVFFSFSSGLSLDFSDRSGLLRSETFDSTGLTIIGSIFFAAGGLGDRAQIDLVFCISKRCCILFSL